MTAGAPSGIRGAWRSLTSLGLDAALDSREARRVSFVNHTVLLLMLYITTRALLSLSDPGYSLKLVSLIPICATVLLLNHLGLYAAARQLCVFGFVWSAAAFCYFWLGGFHEGGWAVLLSAVPWPFMLFDMKRQRGHFFVALGGVLLAIAALILASVLYPLPAQASLDLGVFRLSMAVLSTLLLLLCTWYFLSDTAAAEERLLHERERAEAASRAKSTFLANMSHELRTPLNAILGFSQLSARNRELPAEVKEHLSIINASGEHLLSLLNSVLAVSRIEAGVESLALAECDLPGLLTEVEALMTVRAADKGISLRLETDPSLPRYVETDERKLRQVLLNLLGNAIKFTEEGSVALRARAEPHEARSGVTRLLFEVEDTGVGIPEDLVEGIFEAFAQVPSERPGEGAGLGLAISKGNVELMGGRLSATSAVGRGSRFGFTIEARIVHQPQGDRGRRSRQVTGIEPGSRAADGTPFRVLVVDDHAESREWLTRLLQGVGFEVAVAENGLQAVELNESFAPHMIWMDVRMPVMRGEDAVRAIRSRGAAERQPVIAALTASAFDEDRAAILAAGFDDFLHKPAGADEVLETIARHLGVRYRYQTVGPEGGEPPAAPSRGLTATPPGGSNGPGGVLLVEDEPVNRMLARALLERLGLRVEEAANGEEALAALSGPRRRREDQVDAVLMDIEMPGLDGVETTVRIRADPLLRQLPVIAMTAHALPGDEERLRSAGLSDYLSKPIDEERLTAVLEPWLPRLRRRGD